MLRNALPLGRIAGIRIYAHWSLTVTLGLMTWLLAQSVLPSKLPDITGVQSWLTGLVAAAALLASLLAHELAHSIVAKRNGVRVDRITLWLLGGMSELRDEPRDPRADLLIAAAGPLTSFAIGIASFATAFAVSTVGGSLVTTAIVWLGTTNIVLGLFNLLPGSPLDGGRILRAWLWRRSGDRLTAETAAARSGRNVGLGLIVLGAIETLVFGSPGGLWLMLLGWFLRNSANVELTAASAQHQLGDLRVRDAMTVAVDAVQAGLPVQTALDSVIAQSVHRIFPVLDAVGRPIGAVSLADLVRVPPDDRSSVLTASVARRLPDAARAGAGESLAAAAARVVLRPGVDLIAVTDSGRLVGIVTATDLLRVCDRSALGLPIDSRKDDHHLFEKPRA